MTPETEPCDLLVYADLLMTLDAKGTILHDAAIAVVGRSIAEIGPTAELKAKWMPAKVIEGKGRLAMPGLVNIHNHTPLMITRGMIEDIGFAPMYTPELQLNAW